MSEDSKPLDPYLSPTLPEGPYAGTVSTGRPGWLTTLCVLCIVLGVLGILNSVFGAFGIVGGKALQQWIQPKGANTGMPPEMQEAQDKFQNEMYAVQDKYIWFLVPALVMRFFVALLLLIGGIRALSLNEKGRKLLLIAFAIALGFELLSSILQSFLVMEQMTITNAYMDRLANGMPKDKAGAVKVMGVVKTATRVINIVVLVLAGVVQLLKIALYFFGLNYLRRPQIQALFQPHPIAPVFP